MAEPPALHGLDADDLPLVAAHEAPGGGLVIDRGGEPLRFRRQRLHQRQTAADRGDARGGLVGEICGQEVPADAEALQPAERRAGIVRPDADQLRVGEAEGAQRPRPVLIGTSRVLHELRVEMAAGIARQPFVEIVRDRVMVPHAPEALRVARVAAALLLGRALKHRHGCARLQRRNGRRQAGNARPHDHNIERSVHGPRP